jgi:pilus assembly protein CpaF
MARRTQRGVLRARPASSNGRPDTTAPAEEKAGQNLRSEAARPPRPPSPTSANVHRSQPAPAPPDVYELLRSEVLAAVQDRRIDATSASGVEALVREVVEGYQTRSRSGLGGRPLGNPSGTVARLCQSVLEYGPLTPFVTGEEVFEEVLIVGGDVVYVDGAGRLAMLEETVTQAEMRSILDRLLAGAGASVDESQPMIQVQILDGQGRLGVVIPPIADCLNASLRRYVMRHETLTKLIDWEAITLPAAGLLAACTYTPTGLVVTGQPSSGKTSLANAILRAAPETLRVICCEDTPEINPEHLIPFRWRTRRAGPDGSGEMSLRDLVRMALGMRPDLIVVGEVRGAEAYELTRAGNAGCGMMTTLHANSARAGLQALMSTATMAGQNVDAAQVRAVFTSIVDLVVHLEREPLQVTGTGEGRVRRQVMEIAAIPALQGADSDFAVEPIFARKELGAPLLRTGAPLPDELRLRLDRALRPRGMTIQRVLDGKDVLV